MFLQNRYSADLRGRTGTGEGGKKIFKGKRRSYRGRRGRNEPPCVVTLSYDDFFSSLSLSPRSALSSTIEPDNDGYIIHGWLRAIPRNPRKPSSRSTDQTLLCAVFFLFLPLPPSSLLSLVGTSQTGRPTARCKGNSLKGHCTEARRGRILSKIRKRRAEKTSRWIDR